MGEICLKDVICKHNVGMPGYRGHTVHIIVFLDEVDQETYIWKCNSGGLDWEEGETYNIRARCTSDNQLSYVKQLPVISDTVAYPAKVKSEQLDDADKDTDFFDKLLTSNEEYDIIKETERGC